ncbi:MAG: hypothetical protein LUQ07_00365 [Methanospirillum sp.]|nr:hypothetical protein [Methanospirillum sp.]
MVTSIYINKSVSICMTLNIILSRTLIVFSLILCLVAGASAAEESATQSLDNGSSVQAGSTVNLNDINSLDLINDTATRELVLSNLESNGVNTSVLRAAISVGATGKVKNILEYYKDKIQANPDAVKPEATADESAAGNGESKTTSEEATPVPTGTKSPLSPFVTLIGIAAAGCVAFVLKR